MNYLAHLFLARPTDASRVGNILGDFVRGTPDSLRDRFPDEVIEGIMMHRALDRYTDDHPAFREARNLLAPERRRFAGIIVDIFFDHFLTRHWATFHDGNLRDFIAEMYSTLERNPEWLSPELLRILPRMKHENWLECYDTVPGLDLTFQRVSSRSPRLGPLLNATEDLVTHYQSLERAFHAFFPDARSYAGELVPR